jgi:hypothetical protein
MQARYYDPVMGRFLSVDPVGFLDTGAPGMFNRYSYTLNDPIGNFDPDGLETVSMHYARQDDLAFIRGDISKSEYFSRNNARAASGALGLGMVGVGYACVAGGCAALAPYAGTAWTASNTTTTGLVVGSGVIAGGSTLLGGGDAKQVVTASGGAMTTTFLVVRKADAVFLKLLVGFGGGVTTAAVTDLIDGEKDNSDASYLLSGLISSITSIAPGPPIVSGVAGAVADNSLQQPSNNSDEKKPEHWEQYPQR